jgi:hypothetical protein
MTGQQPKPGEVLDELIQNPRRLGIAHGCLGLVAAFVYWVRPGTFTPHLVVYTYFKDVSPIYMTFIAWVPYAIAFFVSKSLLAGRNPKAVLAYISFATAIMVAASGLYLSLFGMRAALSPILLAGAVTLALIAAAGICAVIWRSDTADY